MGGAGLAVAGWAALASAELGSLMPRGALAVGLAAAGFVAAKMIPRCRPSWADLVALAIVGMAVLSWWPAATPWPAFLDESWYVNAGAAIARSGGLAFTPSPLDVGPTLRSTVVTSFAEEAADLPAFPHDATLGFYDVAFVSRDLRSATVFPYHPPFFSSWIAVWIREGAPGGAGSAVIPWSVVYLLMAGALAGAAFGAAAAPVAMTLLVAGPALAYYGPAPYAETASGALVLGGIWMLARLRLHEEPPIPGAPVAPGGPHEVREGRPGGDRLGPFVIAGLAGGVLGFAILAKIDAVLPAALAAIWWMWGSGADLSGLGGVRHRVQAGAALGLGAAAGLVHLAGLYRGPTGPYLRLNGYGVVRQMFALSTLAALAMAALSAVAILTILYWRRVGFPENARRAVARAALPGLLAALAIGTAVAAVTPRDREPGSVAVLWWLVTPVAMWAAGAGLALVMLRRTDGPGDALAGQPASPIATAVGRRATSGVSAAAGVVGWIAVLLVPALLVAPMVTQGLSPLYGARRLVPAVLPALAILAAGAATLPLRLKPGQGRSVAAVVVGGMLVLALAGSWQAAEPVRDLRDFSGGAVLLDRIARHIEVDGVVVLPSVLDGSNSGRLAAPLWASRGISAAVLDLTTPDERALKPLFDAWSKRGHGIYYVLQNGTDPPDVAGYHAELLGEEGWISRALAPVSLLPAHGTEVSLELDIYRYNTGDFGQ